MNKQPAQPIRKWFAHGSGWAEHEDLLIGDREGLIALRQAIDEAIANGEAKLDCSSEFTAVRVLKNHPNEAIEKRSVRNQVSGVVVWLVIIFLVMCCIYGCVRLPDLFK